MHDQSQERLVSRVEYWSDDLIPAGDYQVDTFGYEPFDLRPSISPRNNSGIQAQMGQDYDQHEASWKRKRTGHGVGYHYASTKS